MVDSESRDGERDETLPLEAAVVREILQAMHSAYLAEIAGREDILWAGWAVNNSEFMPALLERHFPPDYRYGASAETIATILGTGRFHPYHISFVASCLAALADRLLKEDLAGEALPLVETAFSKNRLDLWIQRVLIASHAEINGDAWRIEETEKWLKTRFCSEPFESIETTTHGGVSICCPNWLPVSVGRFEERSVDDILFSAAIGRVRASILDQSFRYCSRVHCVRITQRELPERKTIDVNKYKGLCFPKRVTFSHDPTCNLSCPSCRTGRIAISKSEQGRFDSVSRFLLPLMIHADWVKVCGSGDPFASMHFRNLLRTYCGDSRAHRNIVLHTNGVLCDQRAWTVLRLGSFVKTVMFSLDAAREETYNYTRRDGNWSRALKNLAFLSQLKLQGIVESIELLFVVQNKNFEEMIDFIELAKNYGADKAVFQAIINWRTYSDAEFAEHNIFSPDHPRHSALIDILADSIFDDPIVDLYSVGKFRRVRAAAELKSVAECGSDRTEEERHVSAA